MDPVPGDISNPDHAGTYQRLIVGFHGCDRALLDRVLQGGEDLSPSDNPYDWLGRGIYFWEHGPQRAREFAEWKKARGELTTPAVLGAYIHLGRCFDLADTWATSRLPAFRDDLVARLAARGEVVPENRKGGRSDFDLVLRHLDCAVLNHAMATYDAIGGGKPYFQTVRGIFTEGGPAFEGAGIQRKSHVQVAVRDPSCIMGYFVPRRGL